MVAYDSLCHVVFQNNLTDFDYPLHVVKVSKGDNLDEPKARI